MDKKYLDTYERLLLVNPDITLEIVSAIHTGLNNWRFIVDTHVSADGHTLRLTYEKQRLRAELSDKERQVSEWISDCVNLDLRNGDSMEFDDARIRQALTSYKYCAEKFYNIIRLVDREMIER